MPSSENTHKRLHVVAYYDDEPDCKLPAEEVTDALKGIVEQMEMQSQACGYNGWVVNPPKLVDLYTYEIKFEWKKG